MPRLAEVMTQTFRSFTPEAISERLSRHLDSWWQEYSQSLQGTAYAGTVQTAFFIATFSTMGRLAKADGRIQESEINLASSVMESLKLTIDQKKLAIRLFNEGKQSDFNLDMVLSRFYRLCRHRVSVLQIFMEIQLRMALADNPINDLERNLLQRMGKRLDISKAILQRIERRVDRNADNTAADAAISTPMSLADACNLLQVSRRADNDDIKQSYRRLLNQYHPDKMLARGCNEQEVRLGTLKVQDIKSAYDIIRKAKKL